MAMSRPLRAYYQGNSEEIHLNLLLLGKTGQGKSATGNSILLDKKAFKIANSSSSTTTDVQSSFGVYTTRGGKLCHIKVIDGPGLQDTELSKAQDKRRAFKSIAKVLTECRSGIHAFLVVIRVAVRFTDEDNEAVKHLRRVLGERFLIDYGVIILTYGDQFDDNDSGDEGPNNFKDWCREQTGLLQDLFAECKYRCVLFSNKSKDMELKIEQLETLLETIQEILQNKGGSSYTTELFRRFNTEHKKLLDEFGTEVVKEDFRRDLSDIQKKIRHIKDMDSLRKASSAHNSLLKKVQYEVKTHDAADKKSGKPEKLEEDLKDLKNVLDEMDRNQPGTDVFQTLFKKADEKIDKIVDRATFPDDPKFCQRIQLFFDVEYSNRYF